jgi:hypothetical protein
LNFSIAGLILVLLNGVRDMHVVKAEAGRRIGSATILVATLGATACGGNETKQVESTVSNAPSPSATRDCTPSSDKPYGKNTIIFDDLCGSYSTVHVYPGVTDKAKDKVFSGTYRDNEAEPGVCITTGRSVSSHPELGEQEGVRSSRWAMFRANGVPQFATLVYVQDREQVEQNLPTCTPAELVH